MLAKIFPWLSRFSAATWAANVTARGVASALASRSASLELRRRGLGILGLGAPCSFELMLKMTLTGRLAELYCRFYPSNPATTELPLPFI